MSDCSRDADDPWSAILAPFYDILRSTMRVHLERKAVSPRPHSSAMPLQRYMLRPIEWLFLTPISSSSDASLQTLDSPRIREALELLALLAHVDVCAFWRVVADCWSLDCADIDADVEQARQEPATRVPVRIALAFGGDAIADDVRGPEFLCAALFASASDSNADSAAFKTAKEQLLARRTVQQLQQQRDSAAPTQTVVRVPLCLEFKPMNIGHRDLIELLCSIISIVQVLRDRVSAPATNTVVFTLDAVRLDLYGFALTSDVAALLERLAQLGVAVLRLAIPMRERELLDGSCSLHAQGALLRAITGSSLTAHSSQASSTAGKSTVSSTTFQGTRASVAQVAALCSALAVAHHVPVLNLFSVFDDASHVHRRVKWQWLAYALFSSRACVAVDKLGINGHDLRVEDVDAMIRVIESPHPLQVLCALRDDEVDVAASELVVKAPKGTRVRLVPVDEGNNDGEDDEEWPSETLVLVADAHFPVFADDAASACVSVLVPGHGECWIDRASVEIVHDEPSAAHREARPAVHGVTALALAFDMGQDDGYTAVRRLLRVIGAPLRSLQLFQAYGFTFECLADVLLACPRLEHLYVEGVELNTSDVNALLALLNAPTSSLTSFALEDYAISNDGITRIAQSLADCSSHIARTLKELHIGESTEAVALDAANAQAFLDILAVNRTLLHLELHLPQTLTDAFADRFAVHDRELVPVTQQLFPLPSRLAFLSLGALPRFQRLLQQIDERVVAYVFDFAAQASMRRVIVRTRVL